jgi:hypothetical protein
MKATYITFLFIIIFISCFSSIEPFTDKNSDVDASFAINTTKEMGAKHRNLLDKIRTTQFTEQALYDNLTNDPTSSSNNISHINMIAAHRKKLFAKLLTDYNTVTKVSPKLAEEDELFGEIKTELGKRQHQLSTGDKFENMKMAEINNYYNLRSKAYISFFKFLFYCSIPLLIISVLMNRNILPIMYGKILIGIILFIIIFWGGTQYYDIISRDNMNFEEYDLGHEFDTDDIGGGSGQFPFPTGCINSTCCSEGTIYDSSIGACVIPPSEN